MADDVFHHHNSSIHNHSEIQSSQRYEVRRDFLELQADGGEQQSKRDGDGNDEGGAHISQKQHQNNRDQGEALRQIVQHCFGGELHQIAAIDERVDRYTGRQDVIVQFRNFLVNTLQCRVCVGILSQQHNTGNDIVVIDDPAILVPDRPGKLSQAYLRTLCNHGDIANAERRAVLRQNHGILDIVNIPHQTHFPNIDLLQTGFDEASTSIGVVVGDLLLHLADAEAVGDQLVWVDANLVFARGSAETGNIHDVGNGLEILLHHPVFNRLQLHDVIRRVGGV